MKLCWIYLNSTARASHSNKHLNSKKKHSLRVFSFTIAVVVFDNVRSFLRLRIWKIICCLVKIYYHSTNISTKESKKHLIWFHNYIKRLQKREKNENYLILWDRLIFAKYVPTRHSSKHSNTLISELLDSKLLLKNPKNIKQL